MGLSYEAAEAIDHIKDMWPHFLEIARMFDQVDWRNARKAILEAEKDWRPIRENRYDITREWSDSGDKRLEEAARRDALVTIDQFLHLMPDRIDRYINQ